MKKYMVRCDIEGVSGVVSFAQAEPGKPEYAFGRKMFMADLVALLEGLRLGGAEEVVIYDEHCAGRNIDLGALAPFAGAICGKPPYRPDWSGGLDDGFEGVILLGFHSKFGTPGGLLPHSYEPDIRDIRLNGTSVGEIGMEAAIAGDHGVAVLMVTGDSAGVAEAEALLPGTVGVVVKESLGEEAALCYPLSVTGPAIRAAARKVAESRPAVRPYTVAGTVRLEVELNDGPFLDAARKLWGEVMRDDRTLALRGSTATEVWADYWAKKLRCQAEMGGRA